MPDTWMFVILKLTFDETSVNRTIWKTSAHPLHVTFVRPSGPCCDEDVQTEYFFYGEVDVSVSDNILTLSPANFGYYDFFAKTWMKIKSGGVSSVVVY